MKEVIKVFISALEISSLDETIKTKWIEILKSGKFNEEFVNTLIEFIESEQKQVVQELNDLKNKRDDLDKQIIDKQEENQEKKIVIQEQFRKELKELYNITDIKMKSLEGEIDEIKE